MPASGSTAGYSEDVLAASATQTVTGQTAALAGYGGSSTARVFVNVTAVSGTSPSMTINIQDTVDGSNWYTVASSTAITAVSTQAFSITTPFADRIRVQWVITGTTPSFTFDVRACDQSPLT